MTRRWLAATILVILVAVGCAGKPAAQPPAGPNAGPAQPAAPRPPGSAGPTGPQPASPVVTADEFERMIRAYQRLPAMVGRASFDVKAKAATLGHDLAAAFAFVRDEIANEIYPGVLRGPGGTLSARAGNDLDKAVLLAAILGAQGRQVRYARCVLDGGAAQEKVRAMTPRPSSAGPSDLAQVLQNALVEEGIPRQRGIEIVNAGRAAREALDRTVTATAQADLSLVREALGRARIEPRASPAEGTLIAEAQEHYWVQVEDAGRRQDLDASIPGAEPGRTRCRAAETWSELPDGAYQYVTIRVRNEFVEGEALRSAPAMEQRFRAADLHGQPVFFLNLPLASDTVLSAGTTATATFVPLLLVGDGGFLGESFEVKPQGSGPAGLFSEAVGGEKQLGAQWLDFEITAPGRRLVVSRAIVDVVPPQERAAGAVTTEPDMDLVRVMLARPLAIAVSTGLLDRVQVIEAALKHQNAGAAARVFAAQQTGSLSDQVLPDLAEAEFGGLALDAFVLAFASDRALAGPWLAAYPGARAYRDQPLIVIADITFRRAADGQHVRSGLSLDFRHSAARVVGAERFWPVVHHGLVDGALERDLLAALAVRGGSGVRGPAFSTSLVFDIARSAGIGVRASAGPEAVTMLQQEYGAAGGYRLAAEVGEDTAVVAPAGPVRYQDEDRLGAWTVDLRTGTLVALLDTGLRQATLEEELTRMQTAERAFLNCMRAHGMGACRGVFNVYRSRVRYLWLRVNQELAPWDILEIRLALMLG